MIYDAPPAIVYELPSVNCAVRRDKDMSVKEPISLMAFGEADPNLGVYQHNTKVHFYDHYDITKNAKIVSEQGTFFNYSSLVLYVSGWSSVKVEFNLDANQITEELGLYFTHLSSDLHNGRYDSAIRILVNGQVLNEKYVPPSHDWIKEDYFDLSTMVKNKVIRAGANTVEVQLHNSAYSNYWIHCIKVM